MIRIQARDLPLPPALIDEMRATPQNPRYHGEGNVYNHTLLVLQQYESHVDDYDLSPAERAVLYWAAILHDIGKPRVTYWTGERWSAHGHERAGLSLARDILLGQPELTPTQRRSVLDLVSWHHIPLRWGLQGRKASAYKRLATRLDLRLLGIFAFFDLSGRLCVDKGEVLNLVHLFNHETVPRIARELGTFAHLQAAFAQASLPLKNALWYALRQENTPLLEKLLAQDATTAPATLPRFACHLCLGGNRAQLDMAAADTFAGTTAFALDDLCAVDHTDPHAWQLALRPLRHFLSVYAQAGKPVLLTAPWISSALRRELAHHVRLLQGLLSYTCLPHPLATLQVEAAACLPQVYAAMDLPHPWEAHQMDWT